MSREGDYSSAASIVAVREDLLERLTPGQAHALRILHQSGWLYKEAAARLGVPEASVRTTIHRAVLRAGASDRAQLAYALGAADQRRSTYRESLHTSPRDATLAGTGAADGGALGFRGRRWETTR
jgi:hypothetical protein